MYKPEDFNLTNAPKEMVQYVLDNVDDFEERYQHALDIVGRERSPLRRADLDLYIDIQTELDFWCADNGHNFDDYDIEEIFG